MVLMASYNAKTFFMIAAVRLKVRQKSRTAVKNKIKCVYAVCFEAGNGGGTSRKERKFIMYVAELVNDEFSICDWYVIKSFLRVKI